MTSPTEPTPRRPRLRWLWLAPLAALWLFASLIATVFGVGTVAVPIAIGLAAVGVLACRGPLRWMAAVIAASCLAIVGFRASLTPRADRDWLEEFEVAPSVGIDGDTVTITGVRNFAWSTPDRATQSWETRRYHLSELRGVDMLVEPFPGSPLMAHTMLSFDFGAAGRVVLSIEARREEGERYGSVAGGLNQFELIYLFLDERDALGRRALRSDTLYAFPARVSPLKLRAFFLSLCATAENLHNHPRFYKIIRDNCTTAWLERSDHLDPNPVGLQLDSIFTGRVARLMHERGLMATDLGYEQAKQHFRIDHRILDALDAPDFSTRIRQAP